MARREETVDTELLAQLESSGDRIRVPLPKRKVNEMFAIADQILGGRRVRSICEDGETRLARIPGKMRRRQWVREGDLIVIQPWEFQDEKANVCMRYTKTQSLYLSRKGALPEIVDLFGMTREDEVAQFDEEPPSLEPEIEGDEDEPTEEVEQPIKDDGDEDDIDSFFG
ncbi:MAG: translation initiation factor eIF-1A [Candidatus Thalassarchaeaceae archaeon]|jgi:translation initiation factor 1A|nr:translation initiation factor eIF-1A [Candidatus Thalassarchaeaceae archaeon]MDP6703065.1 translation initiation factor eIF-1A [Candidatus Thalassarchaeaceae archaeon]MDP7003936.1 translation initiation factor eIF-1A [Candidatus Thalassarchaeaceae archaeon]